VISLVIDASTYRGTVAVFRDRTLVAAGHAAMRGAHTEALMPAVADVLARAEARPGDLGRVICGEGPGSFTSLRIAASIAKGLALGAGVPLFAVSSLGLAAAATRQTRTFVVTIDALRDEWYAAAFERDASGAVSQRTPVTLVPRSDIEAFAGNHGSLVRDAEPDASACAPLFDEIGRHGAVDIDRWEPSYGRLAEAQVKWEAAHGRPLRA
jgi:tRNA threonylcarbamoyladenosine biosynthesis protein TsaB